MKEPLDRRISDAAQKCVSYAMAGDRAYIRAKDFLVLLTEAKDWTAQDVEKVRLRAMEELIARN